MDALKQINGLAALTLYWTMLFLTLRLVFIHRYYDQINEYFSTIKYGLIGDLPSIGFMVGLSSLILFIISNSGHKLLIKIFKTISLLALITIITIDYSSLLLYSEWGSTLSWRATSYLSDGSAGWHTIVSSIDFHIIIYILIGIIFTPILFRTIDFFLLHFSRLKIEN